MNARQKATMDGFDYGALLPWVPLAGTFALLAWVGRVGIYGHPVTKLMEVAGITVVASAVLSLLDADGLANRGEESQSISPPTWFLFQLVAWPLGYPAYLQASQKREHPERVVIGWVAALTFVVACLYTWHHTNRAPGLQVAVAHPARFTVPSDPDTPTISAAAQAGGAAGVSKEAATSGHATSAANGALVAGSAALAELHGANSSAHGASPNHGNINVQRLQPKENSR